MNASATRRNHVRRRVRRRSKRADRVPRSGSGSAVVCRRTAVCGRRARRVARGGALVRAGRTLRLPRTGRLTGGRGRRGCSATRTCRRRLGATASGENGTGPERGEDSGDRREREIGSHEVSFAGPRGSLRGHPVGVKGGGGGGRESIKAWAARATAADVFSGLDAVTWLEGPASSDRESGGARDRRQSRAGSPHA
jgi:hypothetical protein